MVRSFWFFVPSRSVFCAVSSRFFFLHSVVPFFRMTLKGGLGLRGGSGFGGFDGFGGSGGHLALCILFVLNSMETRIALCITLRITLALAAQQRHMVVA